MELSSAITVYRANYELACEEADPDDATAIEAAGLVLAAAKAVERLKKMRGHVTWKRNGTCVVTVYTSTGVPGKYHGRTFVEAVARAFDAVEKEKDDEQARA